jgi:hypothetical protein
MKRIRGAKTALFLAACLVLAMLTARASRQVIVEQPDDYSKHYRAAKKDGKCLAVLLTMDGCPGCIDIENDRRYGEAILKKLPHYVKLKVEDYPELAAVIAGGQDKVMCPQLCCFWRRGDRWFAERFVGAPTIKKFVKERVLKKEKTDGT